MAKMAKCGQKTQYFCNQKKQIDMCINCTLVKRRGSATEKGSIEKDDIKEHQGVAVIGQETEAGRGNSTETSKEEEKVNTLRDTNLKIKRGFTQPPHVKDEEPDNEYRSLKPDMPFGIMRKRENQVLSIFKRDSGQLKG